MPLGGLGGLPPGAPIGVPGLGTTRIQDVIIPEIFTPYVINRTAELSELVQSGIITRSPMLDQLVTGGGLTIHMPFWQDLRGESQVLNDIDPIDVSKITANADIAALLIRAKGWSTHELAGALAGSDPMGAIVELVARWWVRDEQRILINILNGVFDSASMADLVLSQPGDAISAAMVLSGKQLLGDAYNNLTAIAMHSATFTHLQKEGAIVMQPSEARNIGPREAIEFPTYLGYRVLIDDAMPVSGNVYTTYLFSTGVIARGEGVPTSLTPTEVDRMSDMSTDLLFNRRAFVLHPLGVKWKGTPTAQYPTPRNEDLAMGTNWERVYEKKQMGIVKIEHTLS